MDLSLHTPGTLTLGASQLLVGGLTVLFLFCSVLLILTVLIQRPQGGGLAGAFGGGGSAGGETAFGARTGDALTMATIAFFVIWLAIAVGLVWVMTPDQGVPGGPPAATSDEGLIGPGDTDETATDGDATDGADNPAADQGEAAETDPPETDTTPDGAGDGAADGAGEGDASTDGAGTDTSGNDSTGGGGR